MSKLPVLDFHDIWLRSAGYIWHVFEENPCVSTDESTPLQLKKGILTRAVSIDI